MLISHGAVIALVDGENWEVLPTAALKPNPN